MERETQLNMMMNYINESRYKTKDNKYKDILGDNDKNTPILDNIIEEEKRKRPARQNSGTGNYRLEPSFSDKFHDSINKQVQFLMREKN